MDPKSESMASQQLKKMIPQLLLSLSLFSFVFSYSSFYSPKFYYHSSVNSLQLLTNVLNKNYLFLICNGLLVFLAKTSGLIRPPAGHDLDDVMQKTISDTLQTTLEKYVLEEVTRETKEEEDDEEEEREESGSQKEVSIFIAESEEDGGEACDLEDGEEKLEEIQPESKSFWLFDDDDDGEQKLYGEEEEREYDDEKEEEDEEEEEEEEETSTEELNQKFEDFIRRMKAEIIVNEARQKLVIVK